MPALLVCKLNAVAVNRDEELSFRSKKIQFRLRKLHSANGGWNFPNKTFANTGTRTHGEDSQQRRPQLPGQSVRTFSGTYGSGSLELAASVDLHFFGPRAGCSQPSLMDSGRNRPVANCGSAPIIQQHSLAVTHLGGRTSPWLKGIYSVKLTQSSSITGQQTIPLGTVSTVIPARMDFPMANPRTSAPAIRRIEGSGGGVCRYLFAGR